MRDIATLIVETGMRPEEVYTLRVENVDLAKGQLQVPRGKTAAARRLLRLTTAARDVGNRPRDAGGDAGALPNPDGASLRTPDARAPNESDGEP